MLTFYRSGYNLTSGVANMKTDFIQPDKLKNKLPENPVEALKKTAAEDLKKQSDKSLPDIPSATDKLPASSSLKPDSVIDNLKSKNIDSIKKDSGIPNISPDDMLSDDIDKSTGSLPSFDSDLFDEFLEPLTDLKETASVAFTGLFHDNKEEGSFRFICHGLKPSTFRVKQFEGYDGISSPFRFEITLSSDDPNISGDSLIDRKATFLIKRFDQFAPYTGIISDFSYLETTVDHSLYRIILQPSLVHLAMNSRSRIFLKKSVPDIIKQVFKDAELEWYCKLDVQSYPQREYVVQYQETDLNFISRLMEECGIWYLFSEEQQTEPGIGVEQIIITDNTFNFTDIPDESTITFRTANGMSSQTVSEVKENISRIEHSEALIPKRVVVKNYNYRTPEVDLFHMKNIYGGTVGEVYEFGGSYKDTSGALSTAELISKRYRTGKTSFKGCGNCPSFRAGDRFTLEEHPRETSNTTYLLTRITHRGSAPASSLENETETYENSFVSICSKQIESFAPEKKTPVPKIPGIMTALIETESSDYAALDEKGRYKVRMTYDQSDAENSNASKYVRLAQPYSGADYGMHFPSHEGTEMIIGHVDGDPNKPVGLGTVPNGNTISPVKETNKSVNMIRTAAGNEISMDDTDGKEVLSVYTPKDLLITADNNEIITVGNYRTKTVGANETLIIRGNQNTTVDENRSLTIIKDDTVTIEEGDFKHTVKEGKATYTVQSDVRETFNGKQNTTVANEISVKSTNSSIQLEAETEIQLKVGESSLVMKKDGTIEIKGINVTVLAASALAGSGLARASLPESHLAEPGCLTLKGNKTLLKATTDDLSIEGINIKSTARKAHNIGGAMVASEGKIVNIVKGGTVQLNPPSV